jgi:K+-sensing histidine kinase KdpD
MNSMMNLIGVSRAAGSAKTSENFLEVLRKLAHTMSQPLTCLRGSVEVALMGDLNESECRQVLDLVLRESQCMAETLERLRELLETEGADKIPQPVSWTQTVEKSLEDAMPGHENQSAQVASDVRDAVWVKASPELLDTATHRLIGGMIKAGHAKDAIRVGLSVRGETACLSVCVSHSISEAEASSRRDRVSSLPEMWGLGELDWWIVRRAVERQGGSLTLTDVSKTCHCCQLYLPLATSQVSGSVRSS